LKRRKSRPYSGGFFVGRSLAIEPVLLFGQRPPGRFLNGHSPPGLKSIKARIDPNQNFAAFDGVAWHCVTPNTREPTPKPLATPKPAAYFVPSSVYA
jgi:hypothetical protein